jgi:hypothetical protein
MTTDLCMLIQLIALCDREEPVGSGKADTLTGWSKLELLTGPCTASDGGTVEKTLIVRKV